DRIRSQFAPPAEASVVDLIFETASGIHRVRRSPEYQRPKLRGTGTTKEQAKAVLWRIGSPQLIEDVIADTAGGGSGLDVVATRIDEVGREIQRAVGLTREQFTQTVLLPQNEFARFLRAGTTERQAVLQRVFGTEIYDRVERQLEEMRKQARREVDAARQTLGTALARFTEATALEDAQVTVLEEHAAGLRLAPLAELAEEHLAAVTARADEAAVAAEKAGSAEQTARTAADAAGRRRPPAEAHRPPTRARRPRPAARERGARPRHRARRPRARRDRAPRRRGAAPPRHRLRPGRHRGRGPRAAREQHPRAASAARGPAGGGRARRAADRRGRRGHRRGRRAA